MKKFVKLCLHSRYIAQNTFLFDEFFFNSKIVNTNFGKKNSETLLTFCNFHFDEISKILPYRYIFYDVNPGEGFNLRRDVFMRIAVMVKQLNQQSTKHVYTLVSFLLLFPLLQEMHSFLKVLPPWGPLYHWQTRSLGDQSKIPWKQFFDVASISRYVPALDYEDYVKG